MANLWDRRTFNPDGGAPEDVSGTNGMRAAAAYAMLEWYNDRYDPGILQWTRPSSTYWRTSNTSVTAMALILMTSLGPRACTSWQNRNGPPSKIG